MLKRLSFEEILENWDSYKQHLKNAGASSHSWAKSNKYFHKYFEVVMGRVLGAMQSDGMHLWISYDNENSVNYLCITRLLKDGFTGQNNLNIFCITRIDQVEEEVAEKMWIEAFGTIANFALQNNCSGIFGTTLLDHLVEKAKQSDLFGEALFTNGIYWPLDN